MNRPEQPCAWGTLRAHLVDRRRDMGLSQAEVARAMGTTQSAVSELETGSTADPGLSTICRWATALDLQLVVEVAEVVVRDRFAVTSPTVDAVRLAEGDTKPTQDHGKES